MRRTSDEFVGKLQQKTDFRECNDNSTGANLVSSEVNNDNNKFQLTFAENNKMTSSDKLLAVLQAALIDIESFHLNSESRFTVLNAILQLAVAFGILIIFGFIFVNLIN